MPLTVALIVLFLAATATGFARVHPHAMRIVLALFTIGALFAPEWAMGGWGVHMRLPAVLRGVGVRIAGVDRSAAHCAASAHQLSASCY